jgi:urease gamma subunit
MTIRITTTLDLKESKRAVIFIMSSLASKRKRKGDKIGKKNTRG